MLLVYMGPMTIAGPHKHLPPGGDLDQGDRRPFAHAGGQRDSQLDSEYGRGRASSPVRSVHAASNLSPDKIQYWFYFGRLNFPNQAQPAPRQPPAAPQAAAGPPRGPNPFIAQAVARSTVAGKPLSSLPADAWGG